MLLAKEQSIGGIRAQALVAVLSAAHKAGIKREKAVTQQHDQAGVITAFEIIQVHLRAFRTSTLTPTIDHWS